MSTELKRPERAFRVVWYVSVFNVILCSLPLEWLGVSWWQGGPALGFTAWWCVWGLGFFSGPEWAAAGVKDGFSGTKTSFLYWTVTDRWPRVLIGLWMGLTILWRFPEFGGPELVLTDWLEPLSLWDLPGLGFTAWLPVHYWRKGIKGPVDHAVIWAAKRIGLAALLEKIRG